MPKDAGGCGGQIQFEDENKVELVSKGGHTNFKLVKEAQINGLRKWEQAFRIHAAIYTETNPERSGEIWQYIHTINVAASSYQWDNVAYYDMMFRQLMAYEPNRSWAKLYHQGWNLAMRDAIGTKLSISTTPANAGNNEWVKDWRDNCCWKFNRNRCPKTKGCNYDHRCTYCGGGGIMDISIAGKGCARLVLALDARGPPRVESEIQW